MKQLLLAITTLALAAAAAGQDLQHARFTQAAASLKRVKCADHYGPDPACWRGRLHVAGKLVIEFDRAPPGEEELDKEGAAFFEPDPASRAKLPAATGYYAAPVNVIWLPTRPREILVSLLGAEATQVVMGGKSGRYEFPVAVTLTMFSASIECDHRNYGMEYSEIRLRTRQMVASLQAKDIGC